MHRGSFCPLDLSKRISSVSSKVFSESSSNHLFLLKACLFGPMYYYTLSVTEGSFILMLWNKRVVQSLTIMAVDSGALTPVDPWVVLFWPNSLNIRSALVSHLLSLYWSQNLEKDEVSRNRDCPSFFQRHSDIIIESISVRKELGENCNFISS